MKTVKIILILCITIICENAYCQEDTTNTKTVNNPFLRQKINYTNDIPKDTIKIFLDDNSYYISLDDEKYYEIIKTYSSYLNSGYAPIFLLSENLPDGYYCIYNITKKEAKKIKNIYEYLVISGEIKNGMKLGAFYFRINYDKPNYSKAEIIIYFKDDVVNGAVIERVNGNIMNLGEYKMGIKHGFFYYGYGGTPSIVLYENGVIIKDSFFY